jgi:hypothetical protein
MINVPCCGSGRAAARLPRPTRLKEGPTLPVRFSYAGSTALTVLGPATGRRYRFDQPGAVLPVDARDAAALASVPGLRQVH